MKVITNIFGSSLGKKYVMALSGCALFLFVIGHLLGNLQIFLGPEMINRYGHFLQSNPELIWPARFGLLLMLVLHVWAAVKLSQENRAARSVGYGAYRPVGSTYASRTMLMSGLIVFAFIIFHLLHFTVRADFVNRTGQSFATFVDASDPAHPRHDVFKMMVVGFSHWGVSGFYVLAMGLLSLHLSHGASAMFQSIGWKNKVYGPMLDRFARVTAIAIFLGYISIPIAVLAGFGKEYAGQTPTAPAIVEEATK